MSKGGHVGKHGVTLGTTHSQTFQAPILDISTSGANAPDRNIHPVGSHVNQSGRDAFEWDVVELELVL